MTANLSLRRAPLLSDDAEAKARLTVIFEDDDLLVTQYSHPSRAAPEEEWHMFGAFGDTKPFGLKLIQARNANAIFYIPKKNLWYQTSPMDEIIRQAIPLMKRKQKTKVINYGSSMGGFAACAFAQFTGANLVISAAPQISIDPSIVSLNDLRWADIGRSIEHKFPDARLGLQNTARLAVIYDPFVTEDQWHVNQLPPREGTELIPFDFCGHAVLHTLKEADILRPLIESIVAGADVLQYVEQYKQIAANTFGYWIAMARWHMEKKELGAAESSLIEALKMAGPTDQAYTLLAKICDEQGQLDEAARYALLAVKGAPNLAGVYISAAQALDKAGKEKEAEALLYECLDKHKDCYDAYSILADFAFRRDDTATAITHMKRATMGRIGMLPWHKVLGDLYYGKGDPARAAQQFRLAQQPYDESAPTALPLYPMYQDGVHPISLGVRAERWSKTIRFNFLELDAKNPEVGIWTIEASDSIAAENFSEASIIKRNFHSSERAFEIIPGIAGYVSIDLPDNFSTAQKILISVSTIENSTISFVRHDDCHTPAYDLRATYSYAKPEKDGRLSILVQRCNSRLPALVKLKILSTRAKKDETLSISLDNHWLPKQQKTLASCNFFKDPKSGLGDINFLLHCEKTSELELRDKLMHWEKAPTPKLKYMVFFMPRSGSTLLCQILAKSGIFGSAHELYIPSNYHPLYRLLDASNASEYIDRIERCFQSPHGVFGTEIDWDRYQIYWRYYLENRMDGYVKFYLDRKEFLSHFISQFYASVANVWFDINGDKQTERDIGDELTGENIAKVFNFLMRQKLNWSRYLHGRSDVKRIYYEDIMSREGMLEIFADLLPDVALWPRVQKEWETYYDDTFFIPGAPKGKQSLRWKIFSLLKKANLLTRTRNGMTVAFPDFLEDYADDILEAAERGINLAPFVRVGPDAMWTYSA